jgi:hypothetical protein
MNYTSPEDKYPAVAARLQLWADWSRGGMEDLGYKHSNMLERIRRMGENAALCGVEKEAEMPVIVECMEDELVKLPVRWQRMIKYQWILGWPQMTIARRLKASRQTIYAWRVHAYGMLHERMYRESV